MIPNTPMDNFNKHFIDMNQTYEFKKNLRCK